MLRIGVPSQSRSDLFTNGKRICCEIHTKSQRHKYEIHRETAYKIDRSGTKFNKHASYLKLYIYTHNYQKATNCVSLGIDDFAMNRNDSLINSRKV